MNIRETNWEKTGNRSFDVAIIGGGINGASLYDRLAAEGYSVVLFDKGDFSCGSSQASAMMIWGGLLYLKNLDLRSVHGFSRDRDILIGSSGPEIEPRTFRYIPNREWGRSRHLVHLALHVYWLIGHCRRERPRFERRFREQDLLALPNRNGSLRYQEGFLKSSDARFVMGRLFSRRSDDLCALNYCDLRGCTYNRIDGHWSLELSDRFTVRERTVRARVVVNCAGVWTDPVNERFGIESPYRHALSKGVFIAYPRPPIHEVPLIFELGQHGDTLTFIPWGPVSLWGPTETAVRTIEEAYSPTPDDVRFLATHAARHLDPAVAGSRPVAVRCGVRPLAVKKGFINGRYPLDISRHHRLVLDGQRPWISVYGGKISGCLSVAGDAAGVVRKLVEPARSTAVLPSCLPAGDEALTSFPGLHDPVPSLVWCVENEFCCTLEDYLRRRTNIAQWVPREGLGFHGEHRGMLERMAADLPHTKPGMVNACVEEYIRRVERGFDRVTGDLQYEEVVP